MDQRKFENTNQESPYLCRGCGYNTTDEERKFYGQIQKDDEDNIICQYHWCVFCVDVAIYKKRFFKSLDYKIHEEKVKLRYRWLKSSDYIYKWNIREVLDRDHYEEVHNAPYKQAANNLRIYNEYEAEYMKLTQDLSDLRNAPRHLYYEALETFGFESDEPPCTRNLDKKNKRKLLKKLRGLV